MSEQQAIPSPVKSQVYLSSSRKDRELVAPLIEKLQEAGITVLYDVDDVLPTKERHMRLEGLIIKADQVVFALSPHSAASEECNREVEVAERLHKRITPVVITELNGIASHRALSRLNNIFFTPPANFDRSVRSLLNALHLNIDWVQEHTRLGLLAHQWHDNGRSEKLKLRGKSLAQAEQWLTMPPEESPLPSPLQRDFIYDSRRFETQRQQRSIKVLGSLLLLSTLVGAIAWIRVLA